jgi:hypothetical protein
MNMSLSTGYFALALILAMGIAAGCIRSADTEYGNRGDYLSVGAHRPQLLDRVVYTVQGQNYVITPKQEGTIIAAVRARVVNENSTQVTLSVDESAAVLTSTNGDSFTAFEPGSQATATTEQPPKDNPYGAHIWGQYQLIKDFEVAGWVFFEVPEDSEFITFSWDDVDFISVPYPR